jgi:hypothetical protein
MSDDKNDKNDKDAQSKQIEALLGELAVQDSIIREGDEYLDLVCEKEMEEIEKLLQSRLKIDEKIAELRVSLNEAHPENAKAVEDAVNSKSRLQKKIKALCHKLPIDRLSKRGMKFFDNDESRDVEVSVSKASTQRIFREDELLTAHPEIRDMSVDGDPVFEVRVVPEVLERVIAEGDLPESVLSDFSDLVTKRAPTVRFKFKADS